MERIKQFTRVPVYRWSPPPRQSLGYVGVLFVYDETDPFAITAKFAAGKRWSWSRDMTALALQHPDAGAGGGDVLIQREGEHLAVTLKGREGSVTMLLPADDMRRFLEATYQLVPMGQEDIDVDAWIEGLLA